MKDLNEEARAMAREAAAKAKRGGLVNLMNLDAADPENGTMPQLQDMRADGPKKGR